MTFMDELLARCQVVTYPTLNLGILCGENSKSSNYRFHRFSILPLSIAVEPCSFVPLQGN
jgi:hypothetical protein